jgi:hypothetical protein
VEHLGRSRSLKWILHRDWRGQLPELFLSVLAHEDDQSVEQTTAARRKTDLQLQREAQRGSGA